MICEMFGRKQVVQRKENEIVNGCRTLVVVVVDGWMRVILMVSFPPHTMGGFSIRF